MYVYLFLDRGFRKFSVPVAFSSKTILFVPPSLGTSNVFSAEQVIQAKVSNYIADWCLLSHPASFQMMSAIRTMIECVIGDVKSPPLSSGEVRTSQVMLLEFGIDIVCALANRRVVTFLIM